MRITSSNAKNPNLPQFAANKAQKGVRLQSEERTTINFEGQSVRARKAVFDFKGAKSALLALGGGKTLTVYYVAAPVRGHFISCVLSYWNTDSRPADGVPMLLQQVMTLNPTK